MSGSAGGNRIESREHFKKFMASYLTVIRNFPGFVSFSPSGSYNSNLSKDTFGDIDLVTYIKSSEDKAVVKKKLASYLSSLPDSVIVPFGSEKYKGKKFLNTGEIITVRYNDPDLNYSVQVDNIIALTKNEAVFKGSFLDLPASKQGIILGLVKIATIETDPAILFKKLHIRVAKPNLPKDFEYEFSLSSIGLQLRLVEYYPGTLKTKDYELIWQSKNFKDVENLLYQYDLVNSSFDDLLKQTKSNIRNPRSVHRVVGIFNSMISIKSGEVNTEKGNNKQIDLDKINRLLSETSKESFGSFLLKEDVPTDNKKLKTYKEFLLEKAISNEKLKTVVCSFGRFNPPTIGHLKLMNKMVEVARKYSCEALLFASHSHDPKRNPLDYDTKIKFLNKLAPADITVVNSNINNPFNMVEELTKKYNRIIVVSDEEGSNIYKRAEKYAEPAEFDVVSAGQRDADADGAEGMSASKMRLAVSENNYSLFKQGVGQTERDAKALFKAVKAGMGL